MRFAIRVEAAMEMGKGILGDEWIVSLCLFDMGCGALKLISKVSPEICEVGSEQDV